MVNAGEGRSRNCIEIPAKDAQPNGRQPGPLRRLLHRPWRTCHPTPNPRQLHPSTRPAGNDDQTGLPVTVALSRYKASNHPQQTAARGPLDDVDDRATHPALFAELDDRYGPFTLDVAAAPHNTKCDRYFTIDDNGLTQPWDGVVWCNPPYSNIAPWVRKAWSEWALRVGPARIVMLLPANRTEQQWWQLLIEPYRDSADSALTTRFLAGRLRFLRAGQTAVGPNERPPFGCVLLIWEGRDAASFWTPDTITGGLFGGGL